MTGTECPFRAVIFDRDGVLADFDYKAAAAYFRPLLPISLEQLGERWRSWGDREGFPASLAEEEQFWRQFWSELADELALSDDVREKLLHLDYTEFFVPFPDARPALLTARRKGLAVGVLSNFSLASLDASLEAIGVADLVDVAAAATVIGVAKPEAQAYLTVTEALGVPPEQCIFFDDERPCVDGAAATHLAAYLVDRRRADHHLPSGIVRDLSALDLILER